MQKVNEAIICLFNHQTTLYLYFYSSPTSQYQCDWWFFDLHASSWNWTERSGVSFYGYCDNSQYICLAKRALFSTSRPLLQLAPFSKSDSHAALLKLAIRAAPINGHLNHKTEWELNWVKNFKIFYLLCKSNKWLFVYILIYLERTTFEWSQYGNVWKITKQFL